MSCARPPKTHGFFTAWRTDVNIKDDFKNDMAAKRRKKHKNQISGLVFLMCYNE